MSVGVGVMQPMYGNRGDFRYLYGTVTECRKDGLFWVHWHTVCSFIPQGKKVWDISADCEYSVETWDRVVESAPYTHHLAPKPTK